MKDGDLPVVEQPGALKRLWMLFAQAVTVALAVYVVVAALKPEWLEGRPEQVSVGSPGKSVPMLQAPPRAPGRRRSAPARSSTAWTTHQNPACIDKTMAQDGCGGNAG